MQVLYVNENLVKNMKDINAIKRETREEAVILKHSKAKWPVHLRASKSRVDP